MSDIKQPLINIGLLGHVANGKSSLVRALTGEKTARGDSRCMQKGESREMTIQIGYSNAKIYQCMHCPKPDCYVSVEGSDNQVPSCDCCLKSDSMTLVQYVSLVDCFDPETQIMMADGSNKSIKHIRVADAVMGDDGTPRIVQRLTNGQKQLYRIKYNNPIENCVEKHEFVCTEGHLLVLRIETPADPPVHEDSYHHVTYCTVRENTLTYNKQSFLEETAAKEFYSQLTNTPITVEITVANYLQLPTQLKNRCGLIRANTLHFNQPINLAVGRASSEEIAWLIGLWLTNETSSLSQITVSGNRPATIDRVKNIISKAGWDYAYNCDEEIYIKTASFAAIIPGLDRYCIPDQLRFSPVSIRRSLLSGIIDGNTAEFPAYDIVQSKSHERLVIDINWLCRSLGHNSRIIYSDIHNQYYINSNSSGYTTFQQFIVEKMSTGQYVGIETDGNSRFLLGDFIIVHNCPGHRMLMKNMISGSVVMDGAILVIDANKDAAQVQTVEHLTVAEIAGIDQYIAITQNKVDLITGRPDSKQRLMNNYRQIDAITQGTAAAISGTPVIPTSFSPAHQINTKLLLQCIAERATPKTHVPYQKYPLFIHCVRSFDINKPSPARNLKGGVIGGTIMNGILRIGDTIEIRPGYKTATGEYRSLITTVTSLYTGNTPLKEARPGGLIGIGTLLDPTLTRSDKLVGGCAGYPGQLPASTMQLDLNISLLMQGVGHDSENSTPIQKLKTGDVFQLAIGAATVPAQLIARKAKIYTVKVKSPVCPVPGQSIPVSKFIDGAWTIIGKANLDGYSDTQASANPMLPFTPYAELLDNLPSDIESNALQSISLPQPQLSKDGGTKLVWTNFKDICAILNRDEAEIQSFFHDELATRITINNAHQLIIHGKNQYRHQHIQKILVKYISSFVKCALCGSAQTILTKLPGVKHQQFLCKSCGAEFLR